MKTPSSRRSLVLFCVASLWTAAAQAKLGTESPFMPRNGAVAPGPAAENTPIEFRGVMTTATGLRFAIYEPARQKGDWVALNESGHDFVVRSYDGPQSLVKVDYQGRLQNLSLKEAKFDGTAPLAAPPVPQIAAQQPQLRQIVANVGAPQVAQAAPQGDPKALQAVADEIRRRRTQRAQAMQGQPQPAAQPAPQAGTAPANTPAP